MRCHALHPRQQIHHERAAPDNALKRVSVQQCTVQQTGTLPVARFPDKALHALLQAFHRKRLVEVIAGAAQNRLYGGFGGVMRGHQNHFCGGIRLHDPVQHFETGNNGHHQICQHDLRMPPAHDFETPQRVAFGEDFKAVLLQRGRDQRQRLRIIIDHEECDGGICHPHSLSRLRGLILTRETNHARRRASPSLALSP